MQLNDGWSSVALKRALDGVIRGIGDYPDALDVRMPLFQFRKDGTSERLRGETGRFVDADDADRLHSHGSNGTGLRTIGEPTDFQSDSRVGHSIDELEWFLSRIGRSGHGSAQRRSPWAMAGS